MGKRRDLLSAVMALFGAGAISRAVASTPAGSTGPGPSADRTGIRGDLTRIGLVANDPAAAAQNTAALKAFVSPGGNCAGRLWFANSTGKDTYFFDDIIPFHDGIDLDLQGCTMHFKKTGVRGDTNSGFIFAIRDFSISNGSIVVDYQAGGGATSAGNALTFGNRDGDSQYFSPVFDSLLPSPMGNIVVRNLRISSNAKGGGSGILMTGGLNGVIMENIWIDGGGVLDFGIYYEFGWATDEPKRELRQTSHAHNMRFSNINISNLGAERSIALTLTGAYNCSVDGLYVRSSKTVFACTPGESAFYRPWRGVDQIGAKRNIAIRNVVGIAISGTAIGIAGASSKSGGYLRVTDNTAADQTDLQDVSIDGFTIDSADFDGGFGIHSTSEKMDLRNGRITNFLRGIVTTHECTRMVIESVDILDCKQSGMQLGQASSIWNPPRQKMGFVRNCFIAGNSRGFPGAFAGIDLDLCATFVIEGNRFGYEASHDGHAETTQGFAVRIGAQSNNVACRCNHTAGVHAEGVAYVNLSKSGAQGNTIQHSSGVSTTQGPWEQLSTRTN